MNVKSFLPAMSRFFFYAALCCAVLLSLPATGAAEPRDVKLEKYGEDLAPEINAGLEHLFQVLNDPAVKLDEAKVAPLAQYVLDCDEDPRAYEPDERTGQGIVYKTDLRQPMEKVIRYLYDPNIPNYVMVPSVLRVSGWYPDSEIFDLREGVWSRLDSDEPFMVRGREFEECTPDSFAGAYYRYDLKRMIVVFPYNGRRVLFSVSEQDGKSAPGKKGAIIDDSKWRYFYSGIEGIDKGLMSWMDTYMYGSSSIQAFADLPDGGTRNVLFKWLDAGWSGINVVRRTHIFEGSMRFSEAFQRVMEAESLPDSETLAGFVRDVHEMPETRMDSLMAEYAVNFEKVCADHEKMDGGDFEDIISNGTYTEVLDREARIGILVLEKLKSALGMETLVDMGKTPSAADAQDEGEGSEPVAVLPEVVPEG